MSNVLDIARHLLLEPAGLTDTQLESILGNVLGSTVDMADIYFQVMYSESWMIEDSIIKHGSYDIDKGVGVRAVSGEKTGFAYSDDIQLTALEQAARAAKSIAHQGGSQKIKPWQRGGARELYPFTNPHDSLEDAEKIHLLKTIDDFVRKKDSRVKQVNASLNGTFEAVYVLNSDGTLGADVRPLVRLNVSVIVEENGRIEQGYAGCGGRYDYRRFIDEKSAMRTAEEALQSALLNLVAEPAPAGMMPVVLGNGWPGILLHEAIGHGLEGDFNRKGTSAFTGRIGERVATPVCTVVDDGTLPERRGSLNMDDEGTPTECTVLIENGILQNYMQDKLNARLMGMKPTGNGRRESYAHLPMPRMTNTYMLPGEYTPEEIIASVERGLYAVNFGGGQVDITSGKFVFSASEAYLIEKGKITRPVKGATLIGNGPEVLTKVSMVGNDLALDHGVGTCGKEGQSVPVGVGLPTIKVDAMTVGGTKA